jgi:HupE / UreJ protein
MVVLKTNILKAIYLKLSFVLLFVCLLGKQAVAHSFPDSKAEIFVQQKCLLVQFKTPVEMLNLAAKMQVTQLSKQAKDSIVAYFTKHVSAYDGLKSNWAISFDEIFIQKTDYLGYGKYDELVIDMYLTPSQPQSLKSFYFNCDAIVHQVVNQSTFIFIKQDLNNGIDGNNAREAGIIRVDYKTNNILPVKIELGSGSWFTGFKSMVALGMQHIKEGTDHMLFLIVLLLPAVLLTDGNKWGKFAGVKYSIVKLLKIVTAFTLGHSATLLISTLGWLQLPSQPIEVLIAISILVSALHAVTPIFPNKESSIAAGFGLVHGLAFASVLANLKLDIGLLVLSILGFNIGIEMMQLAIIACAIPLLMLLSKTNRYQWFRIAVASLSALAAIAWVVERVFGKSNIITHFIETLIQ